MTEPTNVPADPATDPAATSRRCPCGSGDLYGGCCARFHGRYATDGTLAAPTAEALMRSRYAAFALAATGELAEAEAYLLATWAPETRPAQLALDGPADESGDQVRWLRLDVESTAGGGPFDDDGSVTFTAHFRTPAGRHTQHETSRFVRRQGAWLYHDGDAS
ncbi:YchJ family metal-binding protein [Citricoccus sp. I39-566]|uniref:YchJ family protein n=1 Tax=Citricoccus sp. I39-566 TaxID=3073268 RepID=UPI00286ACE76|nr:YchJ family metal-binding protein [Citricoccus sp. I39-566]WMY78590.1 YchJ family metal-binding protein [Citricoccus sp. I39-566]